MTVQYDHRNGAVVIALTDAERKQFISSEAARMVVAEAVKQAMLKWPSNG